MDSAAGDLAQLRRDGGAGRLEHGLRFQRLASVIEELRNRDRRHEAVGIRDFRVGLAVCRQRRVDVPGRVLDAADNDHQPTDVGCVAVAAFELGHPRRRPQRIVNAVHARVRQRQGFERLLLFARRAGGAQRRHGALAEFGRAVEIAEILADPHDVALGERAHDRIDVGDVLIGALERGAGAIELADIHLRPAERLLREVELGFQSELRKQIRRLGEGFHCVCG